MVRTDPLDLLDHQVSVENVVYLDQEDGLESMENLAGSEIQEFVLGKFQVRKLTLKGLTFYPRIE